MSDRLFAIEEVPEVPLFREPRRRKGEGDARFVNDYPPEWSRCPACNGHGSVKAADPRHDHLVACVDCLGMGSAKAMVRWLAGHRCERCHHPYIPKGDARMLGVEPSWHHGCDGWTRCDDRCYHRGPMRVWTTEGWAEFDPTPDACGPAIHAITPSVAEAQWRVLTVHHLDGDKANLSWWNLASLCQRCHLEIQAKVVMERVYPHEHSEWFKPHAAGYYAHVYLGEDLSRDSVMERLDELLALERAA